MSDRSQKSVLYLTNQYPKVSHSFIRRELRAVESLGVRVHRAAFRGWEDQSLVDPLDLQEKEKTFYTLGAGMLGLMLAVLLTKLKTPRAFLRAFVEMFRFSRLSDRGVFYHFICLAHACRMVRRYQDENIDHMHVHFATYPAEVACLMKLLGGPKFSFTLHGPEEFDDIKRMNLQRKVSHAETVVAITSFCRSQILKELPTDLWDKIRIVRCGITKDFLDAPISPKPDQLTFINIGRFSSVKAQVLLVEAFADFLEYTPSARLVLAGDGELRGLVERRIDALGVRESIEITGWIDSERVRELISDASFMVHPSFSEGLPIVFMESMALGRPVIATAIAGHPELIETGVNGWLVPAGDRSFIVEAMKSAAALDQKAWQEMGRCAKLTAQQRHSVDESAKQLTQLFFHKV